MIVTTSKHYYSFSKSGNDLVFHSGERIKGDYRLSTLIDSIYNQFYNKPEIGYTKDAFIEEVNSYYNENEEFERPSEDLSTDEIIREYARHLKAQWGIKLLILGNENSR